MILPCSKKALTAKYTENAEIFLSLIVHSEDSHTYRTSSSIRVLSVFHLWQNISEGLILE